MPPRGKGKGKKTTEAPRHAPAAQAEYEEMILTFDDDPNTGASGVAYDDSAAATTSGGGGGSSGGSGSVKKKKSIKSNSALDLVGPMEVDGSVKSMGAISFAGDFAVREKIEAYGNIDVNGNMNCMYAALSLVLSSSSPNPYPRHPTAILILFLVSLSPASAAGCYDDERKFGLRVCSFARPLALVSAKPRGRCCLGWLGAQLRELSS